MAALGREFVALLEEVVTDGRLAPRPTRPSA
jgi:hypothetical protein